MIGPYPFFGFPAFRRPYPYYPNYPPLHSTKKYSANAVEKPCSPINFSHYEQGNHIPSSNHVKQTKNQNCNTLKKENTEEAKEECFEIFGLKLYFDDLLLIALLFFLYQEEVKDTSLYIALIFLLLS